MSLNTRHPGAARALRQAEADTEPPGLARLCCSDDLAHSIEDLFGAEGTAGIAENPEDQVAQKRWVHARIVERRSPVDNVWHDKDPLPGPLGTCLIGSEEGRP